MMKLSVSRLRTYTTCPQKYYYRYVEEVEADFTSQALIFGKSIHSAIASFHTANNGFNDHSLYRMWTAFYEDEIEKAKEANLDIRWSSKDEETVQFEAKTLLSLYRNRLQKIFPESSSIEMEFKVPLINPATGIGSDTITLHGFLDYFADGNLFEIKTSKAKLQARQVEDSIQLTAYALASAYTFGKKPEKIFMINLIKTKTPKMEVFLTKRTNQEIDLFINFATNVAKAIKAEVFYRNTETQYGCNWCDYKNICLGG